VPVNLTEVLHNDKSLYVDIFGTRLKIRYYPLARGEEEQARDMEYLRELERQRRILWEDEADDSPQAAQARDNDPDYVPVWLRPEALAWKREMDAFHDRQLAQYLSWWDFVEDAPQDDGKQKPVPVPVTPERIAALPSQLKERLWEAINQDLSPNGRSEKPSSETSDDGSSTANSGRARSMGGTRR
jgi:hypothetical protein